MLGLESVDLRYGRVQALFGVSLHVRPGEMVALLGANGSGKSSVLRCLSGLVPVSGGRLVHDGSRIAHVPEGRGTFSRMSVEQNLVMGLYPRRHEKPDRQAELERVTQRFPVLAERRWQRAGALSGGEQQMLALARALLSRPDYLLVDEPSLGLAPQAVVALFDLFDELRTEGLGLLVVEQYATVALARADRAYVLERGRVTYDGDASGLDAARLAGAYLGGTR